MSLRGSVDVNYDECWVLKLIIYCTHATVKYSEITRKQGIHISW